jgi:hypothetical protein
MLCISESLTSLVWAAFQELYRTHLRYCEAVEFICGEERLEAAKTTHARLVECELCEALRMIKWLVQCLSVVSFEWGSASVDGEEKRP